VVDLLIRAATKEKALTPEERRTFVRDHRTAIFGYNRVSDGPAMSIVYYVLDADDTILVSTMRETGEGPSGSDATRRSRCAYSYEQWPPTYLQVYCHAEVDTDEERTVDVMMAIAGVMAGKTARRIGATARRGRARRTRTASYCDCVRTRRSKPHRVTCTTKAISTSSLTHWTAPSLPWIAAPGQNAAADSR